MGEPPGQGNISSGSQTRDGLQQQCSQVSTGCTWSCYHSQNAGHVTPEDWPLSLVSHCSTIWCHCQQRGALLTSHMLIPSCFPHSLAEQNNLTLKFLPCSLQGNAPTMAFNHEQSVATGSFTAFMLLAINTRQSQLEAYIYSCI